MKLLFSLICFVLYTWISATAQPKLDVIGGSTYDWGKVPFSKGPLKGAIKLKNAGNQPLKISEVRPGCGCTTAPLDKKYLKPGEFATINVTLNPGAASGELVKGLTISSNDPKVPIKAITLKAYIMKAIQVLPQPYIAFPQSNVGKSTETTMTLKNTITKPITITQFVTSQGITVLVKSKSIPPGGQVSIPVKAKPMYKGYWNGTITCRTNNPELPEFDVVVYGNAL
ncbi:MAG: DUF1573 domain-containing protein [Bacteroidetes bacterium]|nr:DUF1573 domain-containing protein [Bacteroidota bacterium]